MAQATSDPQRVLVVDGDGRVRAALAALIDATPGLRVAATTASTGGADVVARSAGATVAIVDVDTGRLEDELATIHALAEHLPVVAVGNAGSNGVRAMAAGATAFCDKDGDPDSLTAAVAAAAGPATTRRRTQGVRDDPSTIPVTPPGGHHEADPDHQDDA